MKLRHILLLIYGAVGLLYALYAYFFGATSHRGLFYNLGQGIVWPAVMFPALGKFIGGLIWVLVIAALVFFGSKGGRPKDRDR
ncbi:hypothetical protein [Xenophilus sp. Marseille-Q4582]|uniref:hypothetical protein n=1 Tax=Xenophilus sp. Marseille-Q4582 TaxID=2866600 RepID=UPI001CE45B27|nr:hypothetical protein [Xenophilus sp. Marseille-Q4582]